MSSRDAGPGFWQTLPGILTGIAAVIGAVTALLVALFQAGVFGGGEPAAPSGQQQVQIQAQADADADRIAGKWFGTAKDASGTSFEVKVEILESCKLEQRCGTIRISHVPCQGELFLQAIEQQDYEFGVDNFTRDSSADCTPGAGEHFRLLPDGTLLYTTTYDPKASGILHRSTD